MARLVSPLVLLRSEFDEVNPGRDRRSDGWIGDAHHQLSVSDHNPDAGGNVHAIDVDVDGVPMAKIVAFVVARCKAGTERRLKYVIFRRVIWSASWGWTPRRYTGTNPHIAHAHFSIKPDAGLYRGAGDWGIAAAFGPRTESGTVKVSPAAAKPSSAAGGHPAGSRVLELAKPTLSGDDVRYVQRWIGKARCGTPDGRYGPRTRGGVVWYQKLRGVDPDGVVGPVTWRQMGVKASAR